MNCIYLIILVVSMLAKSSPAMNSGSPNNSRHAADKQFPFMVAIIDKWKHPECSGSLITNKHVLTAAQCFLRDLKENKLENCMAGELDGHFLYHNNRLRSPIQLRAIDSKILHPKAEEYYKATNNTKYSIEHDLAVITVNESFILSEHVSPIEITSTDFNKIERRVLGMGYGLLKPDESSDEMLIYGNLTIFVDHPFRQLYPTVYFTHDEMAECPGDIGSPLYLNNKIIGVGRNSIDKYCTYTNAFVELDWILEQSGQERQSEPGRQNVLLGNNGSRLMNSKMQRLHSAICQLNGQLTIKTGKVLLSGVQMLQFLRLLYLISNC